MTVEQMEGANEELKASNEEIRSINEELQATNEELETSKEELQSLNEETNTINNQLQAKVAELEQRTDDLNNLLNSTDVATLFLDRDMSIRWFTPSMKDLLALQMTDMGRPVWHLAQRFSDGRLADAAKRVLADLTPATTEVMSDTGRYFIRRILPYRTALDRIEGVVVTFVDITERKRTEQQLAENEQRFRALVTATNDVLYRMNPDWTEMRHLGGSGFIADTASPSDEWLEKYIYPEDQARVWEAIQNAITTKSVFELEHRVRRADGSEGWTYSRAVPLLDENGEITEWFGAASDITERKRGELDLEMLTRELSHRVKNTLAVVQSLARMTNGRIRSVEAYREAFLGRLDALAVAHSLLLDRNWKEADLAEIVGEVVSAYKVDHPDVIDIEGPGVVITARQGLGLSIVLHELGTNAAKYGALSRHEGRLSIRWHVEEQSEDRRLRLIWRERHGPKVAPPQEKGFGSKLIERTCSYELHGTVQLDWAPEGLTCEIAFPLA